MLNVLKSILSLVALEVIVTAMIGYFDPFCIGIAYMGEGLPMAFGLLFCWIVTFKLWALYHVFFVYNQFSTKYFEDLAIFIGILLSLNLINILFDPFFVGASYTNSGNGGLNLYAVSMLTTLLFFDLWLFYQYILGRYKTCLKSYKNSLIFFVIMELLPLLAIFFANPTTTRWDSYFIGYSFFTSFVALVWWLHATSQYRSNYLATSDFDNILDH